MNTDVVIVGCGVAGLYCAMKLPRDKKVIIVTKDEAENSDSFLAQGGICVLPEESDYDSFYEDTMRAGHYENTPESVDIMIRGSVAVIDDLVSVGADFTRDENGFVYTKEGAHSRPRILYHEDETGKEITSKLLCAVRKLSNVTLIENYTMVDIIENSGECVGIIGHDSAGEYSEIFADYTVFATGGIGGVYEHSTNFPHLTGDALAIAAEYGIKLKNVDYVQIHPTTLYSEKKGRAFLISESVRGEGAILLNHKGERFTDELQPRDVVANAIFEEMKKEGEPHMWLSLERIPEDEILSHFPNIYNRCLEEGYDITKETVPVVPAQHYFMGGIYVDSDSHTTMPRLYAVGETACNGVHGRNRLASNSLLESLVFAGRAAEHMTKVYECAKFPENLKIDRDKYENYPEKYKNAVLAAIEKERQSHE